jgi:hypothetical protein
MFKLFKKNYYRITVQSYGLRGYYIIKAKNEMQAELKLRKKHTRFAQIISIEKVEETEIE